MNPADKAAIEQNKFYAAESRREAGSISEEAATNIGRFIEEGDALMGSQIAIFGKTGSLGLKRNAPVSSGIDVGAEESQDLLNARKGVADLGASIQSMEDQLAKMPVPTGGDHDNSMARKSLAAKLNKAKKDLVGKQGELTTLEKVGAAPDFELRSAATYATGSSLLAATETRDKLERHKRDYMRNVQTSVAALQRSGANYDKQAGYARQAAAYNTLSTILGGVMKVWQFVDELKPGT